MNTAPLADRAQKQGPALTACICWEQMQNRLHKELMAVFDKISYAIGTKRREFRKRLADGKTAVEEAKCAADDALTEFDGAKDEVCGFLLRYQGLAVHKKQWRTPSALQTMRSTILTMQRTRCVHICGCRI